jgi:hypothetical protein
MTARRSSGSSYPWRDTAYRGPPGWLDPYPEGPHRTILRNVVLPNRVERSAAPEGPKGADEGVDAIPLNLTWAGVGVSLELPATALEVAQFVASGAAACVGADCSNIALLDADRVSLRLFYGSFLDPSIADRYTDVGIDEPYPIAAAVRSGETILLPCGCRKLLRTGDLRLCPSGCHAVMDLRNRASTRTGGR